MLERQRQRLREKLAEIDASLRRRPAKDVGQVERRIGRWLGRSPAGERLIEVKVRTDKAGRACGLEITARPERTDWAQVRRFAEEFWVAVQGAPSAERPLATT